LNLPDRVGLASGSARSDVAAVTEDRASSPPV
jgi:hypothetical protein